MSDPPPRNDDIMDHISNTSDHQEDIETDLEEQIQDNIIEMSFDQIETIEHQFKAVCCETVRNETVAGYINRLNSGQKAAFDKIINPCNKK